MAVELRTVEKGGVARKKRAKSKYAYKLVLASDRWDLIRSWEKVREKLKQVNPFLPEKEFSIYLEDTLQVTRILKSQCHVKDVAQVQFSGVDVILCTGFSTTVTRWTLKANGRKCETDLLKFPYIISIFFYIVEIRVFVCLTLENLLVILVLSQGCIKEARRVEHLYNAQCLTYIKETKQIIAAGIGLLKYYSLSGIEVCVTIEKTGNIKTTMAKNEYIMQVLVDPSWRRLLVLGESGVYVINYMTMKQEFVLTGSQDAFAHISCCSVYQDKYIVTGSEVGIIRIWASFSFSKVKELEGHRRSITAVCCHPRQPLLFSSSTDGIIFIWRMDNFSKFRQVHTGDTVRRLGMMWDTGIVAMWCLVTDRIFIYEFCDFYIQFSSLESEVLHLQRLMGHGEHPNRIMVATIDGGMKFLSPVTGSPLGFMYPVISLEKIDVFVYSAFRRNIYMLLKSGSILEVGCTTSPFQAVEVHESVNVDETVYCLISIFLVIQTGGAEIKDELILLGLCNGQISVLESESFTLPAPVQAHLGCVYCLESVAEVSLEEQVQYTTCRYILSAGSDNTVKLWYLRCYFTEHGPELAFHILAKIRCEMTPKRLSGTSERIFAVYDDQRTMAMFDICHLFNDSPHPKKVSHLKHTSDYDHTDQITALDKCPLVGIFATSSLDGTVKIWGNDFQLVRELVYFVPLLSLCFVSNRGDLLVGKENVIILCQVEKYLPRHRLDDLITRNFEDEHKEPPLKFKEGVSSWINPAVMPKSAIPHCLRNQSRAAKVPVTSERWCMSWDTPRGKREFLNMPVTVFRSQRPVSSTAHKQRRNISVVLPIRPSEDAFHDTKMVKAVHESMSYTIFHARKFTMPKVVVKAHPADSIEGLINSRKQSGRSLASQREESQLWLSLETNPNEKRSHAKGLTNIMKDIKRFIKEEKKDRKVRKSIEAKIETARVAAKNLWDRKTRRSTEMSLDKHKHKDSKALEQPWKLHERDDTNIDTVQEANPEAVMLDSKNLVPTHYNILRDDKNPLQLLKVFMERGKQSHLEESSDSSSSSDEAEIVREAEDESGLFVSSSSLPTRKRAARSGFTFRGLQTLREFLKQHGVVVSLKIANIFRELLFSRRPIDSSVFTSGSLKMTTSEKQPLSGDSEYKIDESPYVDEEGLNRYRRKMKAVELPNSVFKKEVHLPPSPPPTVEDCLNEKAAAIVDALEEAETPRPQAQQTCEEEEEEEEAEEGEDTKVPLPTKKKGAKKRHGKKGKRKKGKKEKKELEMTEWRRQKLPVFSTKLVFPLVNTVPPLNETNNATKECVPMPKHAKRSSVCDFSQSIVLPVVRVASCNKQIKQMLTVERPADGLASLLRKETAPTSFTRTSVHPFALNHEDVESGIMMSSLPFDQSNNASSSDDEREICCIHLSMKPAETTTPVTYTAYPLSEGLTKDHQSRPNNACSQTDKAEEEVDQLTFLAKMSSTIIETFAQQTRLLEQLRREKWYPRQVNSSNPVTTFSALLGLLVHGTNPDVIAQVCGYLLNLKRHFFIPKSFRMKSAALLLGVLKSSDDVQLQRVCLYSLPQLTHPTRNMLLVVVPALVKYDQDISLETVVDPQRGLSVRVTSTVAEQGQVDTGDSQHSQVSNEAAVESPHGRTEETDRKSSDEELSGLQYETPLFITGYSKTSHKPPGPKDTSAARTPLHHRHQDASSAPPSHHSQTSFTHGTQDRVLSDGGNLDGRRVAVNPLVVTKNVNIPSFPSFAVFGSSFKIRRYLHITRKSSYFIIKSHNIPRKLPVVPGESSHITSGCSQEARVSSFIIRKSARLRETRLYPSTRSYNHGKQRRRCQFPLKLFSTEVPDIGNSNDLTDERVIYVWDSLPPEEQLRPSTCDHEHGEQCPCCQFPLKVTVSKVPSTEVPDLGESNSLTDKAASDVPNKPLENGGASKRAREERIKPRVTSQRAKGDNLSLLQPLPHGLLVFNPTMEKSCSGRLNKGCVSVPTRQPFQRLPTFTSALKIPDAVSVSKGPRVLSRHILGPEHPVSMATPQTVGLSPAKVSQRRVLLQGKTETRPLGVVRNRKNHTSLTRLPNPLETSLTRLPQPQDMSLTRLPQPQDMSLTRLPQPQDMSLTRLPQPQDMRLTRLPQPQDVRLTRLLQPQDMSLTRLPQPQDVRLTRLLQPQDMSLTRLPKPHKTSLTTLPNPQNMDLTWLRKMQHPGWIRSTKRRLRGLNKVHSMVPTWYLTPSVP